MSETEKKGGFWRTIIGSIIVALLAGGTAPWWWKEFFGSNANHNGSGFGHPSSLPAPATLDPKCGEVYPEPKTSYIPFAWTRVDGASHYTVEVDLFDCSRGTWFSQTGRPWHIRTRLGIRSPFYGSDLFTAFREQNGCALRWRVWATDQNGLEGQKSEWCQISFHG